MSDHKTFLILLALPDEGDRVRAREKLIEAWLSEGCPFAAELKLEIEDVACVQDALLQIQDRRPDAVLATLSLRDVVNAVDIPASFPEQWQMEVALLEKLATHSMDQSLLLTLACIRWKIPYLKFFCIIRHDEPREEFKAHRLELLFETGEAGVKFGDTILLRPDLKGRYATFLTDLEQMGLRADLAENRYRRAFAKNAAVTIPTADIPPEKLK